MGKTSAEDLAAVVSRFMGKVDGKRVDACTRAGDCLLTVADAARVLDCDRELVTRGVYSGQLPSRRIPGTKKPRVLFSDLVAWLEEGI